MSLTPQSSPVLTEDEAGSIAKAVLAIIDQPRRRSESAQKTILIDLFGTANAGKTTVTSNMDRFFRRNGYQVFCPPETAEHEDIRGRSTSNSVVAQLKHLNGVMEFVANLANDRNFHLAVISRGLIDMLYWYRVGLLNGQYRESYVASVREWALEHLRENLVDAFFFFTCSPEVAMEREYANSPTKKQGTNMNPARLAQAHQVYAEVLDDVQKNVPDLPIFRVDTTTLNEKETSEEVLRQLLSHLERRFEVSGRYLSRTPSLLRKRADQSATFEEQLKLRGHRASGSQLIAQGWEKMADQKIEDTYLNTGFSGQGGDGVFAEISRIRMIGDAQYQFTYKSRASDRILSHRRPITLGILPDDVKEITQTYPTIAVLKKQREQFSLSPNAPDGHFFTIHLDTVEGLGEFTEIRALGSDAKTHTKELFDIAASFGFTLSDVVEGSYLGLLQKK